MECTHATWLEGQKYLEAFNKKVFELRVPLSGSIDLTHQCNLRCVHCYLGSPSAVRKMRHHEMDTKLLLSVIDEIAEAGCLFLLITGGEPLMRDDFIDVYRHIKSKGIVSTVFTNGTLITDTILGLFKDFPPQAVEISLYGATAETYEKITGVTGSFRKCLSGIERLLEHNIPVRLKTILMTLNRHEFYDMERMAKDYGVKFRFDAAIFPRLNGDQDPLLLRVDPEDAVELECSDGERVRQWRNYCERFRDVPLPETLYICGAGVTSFHIDAYGNLSPCLMTRAICYSLSATDGSFSHGWHGVIPHITDKKAAIDFACSKCETRIVCGYCPAFFGMENGSEDIRSEYLCSMGKHRLRIIQDRVE
jgi:radical SAM protein with 4Fe4S-binding SPASM domain